MALKIRVSKGVSKPRGMYIWSVTLCNTKTGQEIPAGTVTAKTSERAKAKAKAYVRKTFGGKVLGAVRKKKVLEGDKKPVRRLGSIRGDKILIKRARALIDEGFSGSQIEDTLIDEYDESASSAWNAYLVAKQEKKKEKNKKKKQEEKRKTVSQAMMNKIKADFRQMEADSDTTPQEAVNAVSKKYRIEEDDAWEIFDEISEKAKARRRFLYE